MNSITVCQWVGPDDILHLEILLALRALDIKAYSIKGIQIRNWEIEN